MSFSTQTIGGAAGEKMFLSITDGFDDYRLIDSGNGRKLEKFGKVVVDRPEVQAIWQPKLPASEWQKADGIFTGDDDADQGRWKIAKASLETWPMRIMDVTTLCRFSAFRHLGVFPEQLPHWAWMDEKLKAITERPPRLLNLFAYTGVASLVAGDMGAEVTHVDASKKAIDWAKKNQAESGLEDAKIRWILDDARKFTAREVRRGRQYDGILVDPPKFGRGPEGEVWDFFTDMPALLEDCRKLLDPSRGFLILTSYAIRASFLSIDSLMRDVFADMGGRIDSGELAIREQSGGRILSTSHFSRWYNGDI